MDGLNDTMLQPRRQVRRHILCNEGVIFSGNPAVWHYDHESSAMPISSTEWNFCLWPPV